MIKSDSSLILRLWRIISEVHDTDELFYRFTALLSEQYSAQVVQLWTYQGAYPDTPVQLRTIISQDASLPGTIFTNTTPPIAALVKHNSKSGNNLPLQPVERTFSSYIATLLRRYGCNYCTLAVGKEAICLASEEIPYSANFPGDFSSPPVQVTLLLFLREIPQKSLTEIDLLLQQTLALAEKRHLVRRQQQTDLPSSQPRPLRTSLAQLIPLRTIDAGSNPLTLSIAIADKHARSLYAAINNRRNIAELATATRLTMADIYNALCLLLEQKRIHIYDPQTQARLIDISEFIHWER